MELRQLIICRCTTQLAGAELWESWRRASNLSYDTHSDMDISECIYRERGKVYLVWKWVESSYSMKGKHWTRWPLGSPQDQNCQNWYLWYTKNHKTGLDIQRHHQGHISNNLLKVLSEYTDFTYCMLPPPQIFFEDIKKLIQVSSI